MKKIFFFLTALLSMTAISASAGIETGQKLTSLDQLDNTNVFTIVSEGRGALAVDGSAMARGNITADPANQDHQFAIVKYKDAYYLYSIGAKKFVVTSEGEDAVLSAIGEPVTLVYNDYVKTTGEDEWALYWNGLRLNKTNPGNDGRFVINKWGGTAAGSDGEPDNGNSFYITSAGTNETAIKNALEMLNTVDVTFHVKYNGEEVETGTGKATIGIAPVLPDNVGKAFCIYSYDVATVTADTKEITATYESFEGPFEASTSFDDAKWYFVKINGKYTYWEGTKCPDVATNSKENNAQWAFVGDPYAGFKIYNKSTGDGYLLQGDTQANDPKVQVLAEGTTENDTWSIEKNGDSFYLKYADKKYLNDHGGQSIMTIWESGSVMNAEAVPAGKLTDVTYKIFFNNIQVASDTDQQYTGEKPKLPQSLDLGSSLCTYTFRNSGNIEEGSTYEVDAKWVGPFQFSNSVLFANIDWKNLTIEGRYINYADSEPYPNVQNASDALRATDEYQWAFLGDPYNVVIINKAGGFDKSLKVDGTGNGAQVVLRDGHNTFTLKANGESFSLYDTTVPGPINNFGGNLKIWENTGNGGGGSKILVVDVPEVDYVAAVKEDVTPWMESAGKPFGLKQSVYNEQKSAYEAALTSCTKATYDALKAAVTAADAVNEPETGYYRIYNTVNRWKQGKGYIGVKGNGTLSANIIANGADDNDIKVNPEWAATVIRVEKTEAGYTFAIDGKYIGQPNGDASVVPLVDEAVVYTYELYQPTVVKLQATTNNQWLHRGLNAGKDLIAWYENGPSDFSFEAADEITVPLNEVEGNYYATLCVPFEATASKGEAYTIEVSGDNANGTKVEAIAAGTPVVLVGTAATATLTIGEGYAAKPVATTGLTGNYLPKTTAEGDLFLGNYSGTVGFYGWTGKTVAANHAHIQNTSGARGIVLNLDGEATGINMVENSAIDNSVYNLNGVRREGLQKGLNIVRTQDGARKVLVK